MLKATTKKALSWLMLVLFLFIIIAYARNNWHDFSNLKNISWSSLTVLLILSFINLVLQSLTTNVMLRPFKIRLRVKEWLGITVITLLGNYFIPFGGLGFRAAYLKRVHKFEYTHFISTLATLYIIQFLVYTIGGLIGLIALYQAKHLIDWKLLTLFAVIATACFIFIFFSPKLPVIKNKFYKKILKIAQSFYKVKRDRKLLRDLTLNSLALFFSSTLIFYLTYRVLHFQVSFLGAMIVACFSFYTMLIRITPASFGIYEATIVYSASLFNLTIADGLVVALITRLILLSWILLLSPYFGYHLFYKGKKKYLKLGMKKISLFNRKLIDNP